MNTMNYDEIEMAPTRDVRSFNCEAEAFEYSLAHARKVRGRFTAAQCADEIRWSRANMTKIRQEQAGFPVDSSKDISDVTQSYALQQYRNEVHGLVTKTKEQEDADLAELQMLRSKMQKVQAELNASDDECVELRSELARRR